MGAGKSKSVPLAVSSRDSTGSPTNEKDEYYVAGDPHDFQNVRDFWEKYVEDTTERLRLRDPSNMNNARRQEITELFAYSLGVKFKTEAEILKAIKEQPNSKVVLSPTPETTTQVRDRLAVYKAYSLLEASTGVKATVNFFTIKGTMEKYPEVEEPISRTNAFTYVVVSNSVPTQLTRGTLFSKGTSAMLPGVTKSDMEYRKSKKFPLYESIFISKERHARPEGARGIPRMSSYIGGSSPTTYKVSSVSHEFGHLLHEKLFFRYPKRMAEFSLKTQKLKAVSNYGNASSLEAFAESFALYSFGASKAKVGNVYYNEFTKLMTDCKMNNAFGVLIKK